MTSLLGGHPSAMSTGKVGVLLGSGIISSPFLVRHESTPDAWRKGGLVPVGGGVGRSHNRGCKLFPVTPCMESMNHDRWIAGGLLQPPSV